MPRAKILLFGAALVGVVWGAGWLLSCDDDSVGPKPTQARDYAVYFWNEALTNSFYEYHPLTRTLDSFATDHDEVRGLAVSADGGRLFLSHGDVVSVVDSDSLSLISTLPYRTSKPVLASSDGRLLALMSDSLWLLNAHELTARRSVEIALESGTFLRGGRVLYGIADTLLYIVNTEDGTWITKNIGTVGTWTRNMAVTPDGLKLLQYFRGGFRVLDLKGDSTLFLEYFYPGEGFLVMTPDGRYAFYSNPSTGLGAIGTTSFKVLDVRANRILMEVDTDGFLDSLGYPNGFGFGVSRMVVTPDNRWLFMHNWWPSYQFLLFDIWKMRLVDFHDFTNNHWFSNPAVQSGP